MLNSCLSHLAYLIHTPFQFSYSYSNHSESPSCHQKIALKPSSLIQLTSGPRLCAGCWDGAVSSSAQKLQTRTTADSPLSKKKGHRQPAMLAKKPPPEGARIGPSIITRVKTAWCHKRSSIDVTQSGMAARTTGATAAATPWKTRPITNQTNVSAHAQQKVLATSSTWQHRIMMRRPMESDKGPRNNMQTAEVNR